MKKVTIHSDGGCDGNPGPGGWAAVLRHGEHAKEISGGCPATTNNRMEMQAAVEALRTLKEPCEVEFFTDSKYLQNGISTWIKQWKARGWRTVGKAAVKNEDLWRALDEQATRHRVQWCWLKGHAGHEDNERCDELAAQEIAKIRKAFSRDKLATALEEFKVQAAASPPHTPRLL